MSGVGFPAPSCPDASRQSGDNHSISRSKSTPAIDYAEIGEIYGAAFKNGSAYREGISKLDTGSDQNYMGLQTSLNLGLKREMLTEYEDNECFVMIGGAEHKILGL